MSLTRQSYIGSFLGTDHRLLISLFEGMTLLLRKSSAQARIEGWDPRNRSEDDYAVVDDTIVGRIYREMILKQRFSVCPTDRDFVPCSSRRRHCG